MAEQAGQSILHGLVAAGAIFVLLRLWPDDSPELRLRFQLLAVALPALLTPAYWYCAPWRSSDAFSDQRALFSTQRMGQLRLAGRGLDRWLGTALAIAGSALLLRDLAPFLLELSTKPRRAESGPQEKPLGEVLQGIASSLGAEAPAIACVEGGGPRLLTVGLWRPRVVVSTALLERLTREELRAALAHEMAHVVRRDPLLGAGLMGLRTLLFFNPAVQLVARAAVQEMERRADEVALQATGNREALVRGLLTGFHEGEGRRTTARGWQGLDTLGRLLDRFRVHAIDSRCRRLLLASGAPAPSHGGLRLGLTSVALAVLLYYVV